MFFIDVRFSVKYVSSRNGSIRGPGPPFVESAREIMLSFFRRLMNNNQGATVVEYTLIASLIAVAAIASMRSVGTKVSSVLGAVGPAIN